VFGIDLKFLIALFFFSSTRRIKCVARLYCLKTFTWKVFVSAAFVMGIIDQGGPDTFWWTGVNDIRVEGQFEDANNHPITFTDWFPGQCSNLSKKSKSEYISHWL
jgi:hypothetical protein